MGELLRDYGNTIMDLQKVAAQTSAIANQRAEGGTENKGVFTIPFADMIRSPVLMVGELFSNRNEANNAAEAAPDHPASVDKADNQRSDNGDERQVEVRDNSRNDSARTDDRGDGHADDPADDTSHRTADSNRDNSKDDPNNADSGEDDTSQQASAEDSENDETSSDNSQDTDKALATSDSEQDGVDHTVTDPNANVDVGVDFDKALDNLLVAAHAVGTEQNGEIVKEAAKALSNAAVEPKAAAINDTAKSATFGGAGQFGNGENANANGEQSRQTQQAQMTLARVGSQAPGSATEAAKNTVDQSLVEQQAKALADSLKSDKPVKIQVNVDNRAGAVVTQTSQSLNANAVAAQETANAQTARTNSAQAFGANESSQQTPQARVDGNAAITGQAKAVSQLTQSNANAAADSGLNRATAQISSATVQSTHGGGEGSNGTAPGGSVNAQQAANAQKAEQAQAARSPQQARPLAQQISVNITKAISDGLDRISIQLRPDNLGRVEVKLEVAQNGRVNANIIVDRPETLEMLRNDSRNLERALQDAGLDTQSGDLSFNLRDHQENPDETQSDNRLANDDDSAEDGNLEAEIATKLLNGEVGDIISDMRVDIRA